MRYAKSNGRTQGRYLILVMDDDDDDENDDNKNCKIDDANFWSERKKNIL